MLPQLDVTILFDIKIKMQKTSIVDLPELCWLKTVVVEIGIEEEKHHHVVYHNEPLIQIQVFLRCF